MSRRQGHSWGWTLPLQLNSAGLEKVGVQAYTSSELLRVGLCIAWYINFNNSTYLYIPSTYRRFTIPDVGKASANRGAIMSHYFYFEILYPL